LVGPDFDKYNAPLQLWENSFFNIGNTKVNLHHKEKDWNGKRFWYEEGLYGSNVQEFNDLYYTDDDMKRDPNLLVKINTKRKVGNRFAETINRVHGALLFNEAFDNVLGLVILR
jgi:hypothetical protein